MHALVRLIERLSGGFGVLGAIIVAPLILATVYEVFSRYLFNAPTIWAYEIAYMAMGANFLLGAAVTLRDRGHIRIDLLYARWSPRTQALIDIVGYACLFLPVAWWLSWGLWKYAFYAYLSGETSGDSAWNPIIWPFRLVFFAGFVLLALQATAELIKAVYILAGREPPGASR
ncbi:MAG: TRAP transporter small permease subunit [Alphaproteobacteria bacterium]|jgi:TRAP-type mannitol/chloroaromatic compound transport system permease small subunit|nr:TRAP transporter small permease subunit [Alphaproteobacteria bacterium]